MITHSRKIDMYPASVPVVIHLSQYDDDFTIEFTLYSSVGAFTVEPGTTAKIRGTKKDGMGYSVGATLDVTNKKVTVAGDQQMTAVAGKNIFELTLTKNYKELNTANFILDVERAALDKDTLVSKSVIKELVNVIDGTDELISTARQIDADKQIVAGYKADAQTAATNAAGSASAAKTSEGNAKTYANNASTAGATAGAAAGRTAGLEAATDAAKNVHVSETRSIPITGWVTHVLDGTTYYAYAVTLTNTYKPDHCTVSLAPSGTNKLPTTAEAESYNRCFATLEGTTLRICAAAVPDVAFSINVTGVTA